MSLSSISSANSYGSQQTDFQSMKEAFDGLGKALKSGDLSTAQTDLATIEKNAPRSGSGSSEATSTSGSGAVSVASQFSTLSSDLSSGDLSGAQAAYSNIQKTMAQHAKHGGGHGGPGGPGGQMQKDMQSLSSALSSGDLSAAQSAFATLQKDMQPDSSSGSSTSSVSSASSVSGASTSSGATSTSSTSSSDSPQALFDSLSSALGSGDLSGAQSAFAGIEKQMQSMQGPPPGGGQSASMQSQLNISV